jgi:RNA polymerase sigma factor (sigma-70 family)
MVRPTDYNGGDTMPNFDRTIDSRWRPDFESSRRRVREEGAEPEVTSRDLALIPTDHKKAFEPHDSQTAALIRRLTALERLPHGEKVTKLVGEWDWIEKMMGYEEKQRFLEPLILAAQRKPGTNEHLLIFLMLVFEPVRRSVSKAFMSARSGLDGTLKDMNWGNRAEAHLIQHVERQQLFDVTREAALEALYKFPTPAPDHFFRWLREAIAHRALDKLRGDLPEVPTSIHTTAEAEAIQLALAGFERAEGPVMADRAGMREWRSEIHMRDIFDVVEDFFQNDAVREACQAAVGRLPQRQREVITGYFFEETAVADLAERRGVSESTIYNHKSQAEKKLHDDDAFFSALISLERVRDKARMDSLAEKYPDGRFPDGRRIVHIEAA